MSWMPGPLVPTGDDRTPVTVWLDPAEAVRLELVLAHHRDTNPSADENDLVDAIFTRGLAAAEEHLRK